LWKLGGEKSQQSKRGTIVKVEGKRKRGRGEEDKKAIDKANMIKVHYLHVWKYHNETPLFYN
jgi:hypothetical protein